MDEAQSPLLLSPELNNAIKKKRTLLNCDR
jgi:hypothetical protein